MIYDPRRKRLWQNVFNLFESDGLDAQAPGRPGARTPGHDDGPEGPGGRDAPDMKANFKPSFYNFLTAYFLVLFLAFLSY